MRDLAEWIVHAVEQELSGTFNATNEGVPWRRAAGRRADVTWVTDEFLQEHDVGEWMELPLWIADVDLEVDVEPGGCGGSSLSAARRDAARCRRRAGR